MVNFVVTRQRGDYQEFQEYPLGDPMFLIDGRTLTGFFAVRSGYSNATPAMMHDPLLSSTASFVSDTTDPLTIPEAGRHAREFWGYLLFAMLISRQR
jgi:hypothetical protein